MSRKHEAVQGALRRVLERGRDDGRYRVRYNLFYYVYVLSFFDRARTDERYREALDALTSKLDSRGRIVIEQRLAKLSFCAKGRPSELATRRYREILKNHAE